MSIGVLALAVYLLFAAGVAPERATVNMLFVIALGIGRVVVAIERQPHPIAEKERACEPVAASEGR